MARYRVHKYIQTTHAKTAPTSVIPKSGLKTRMVALDLETSPRPVCFLLAMLNLDALVAAALEMQLCPDLCLIRFL